MNAQPPDQQTLPPIKGSWEDLLRQAQQLARNFNDDAIPILRKIVDGLTAMPAARRNAANRRLHNVLMAAALDLQGYYNVRDRHEDSLGVLEQLRPVADERDQEMLDTLTAEVLMQAGRTEEALTQLRQKAEAPDAELGDWGQLVMAHVRAGQPGKAIPVLQRMAEIVDTTPPAPDRTEADERNDLAYVAGLRGIILLEMGDLDGGIAAFENVVKLGGAYAKHLYLLYGRLIHQGRHDDAMRFIDMDRERPIRAAFWRGVSQYHSGEEAKARQTWESVANRDALKTDPDSMMEYVLSHYYLGDPKSEGLEIMLAAAREQSNLPWLLLYLLGLGWGLRGDMRAAKTNFQLAVTQIKSLAEGNKLPWHYWFFARDIIPAERLDEIRGYFEVREDEEATGDEPEDTPETPDNAA